jgi:hypothetical protein
LVANSLESGTLDISTNSTRTILRHDLT